MEIFISCVKGMEILLAASYSLYASHAVYWNCIFWSGAFSVFCCGEYGHDYCILSFIVYLSLYPHLYMLSSSRYCYDTQELNFNISQIADKSCSNFCICIILFPSKHCQGACTYERNQGNFVLVLLYCNLLFCLDVLNMHIITVVCSFGKYFYMVEP